jgi:predicted transcriptional regulator
VIFASPAPWKHDLTRLVPCYPEQAHEKKIHLTPTNEISGFADYFLIKKNKNRIYKALRQWISVTKSSQESKDIWLTPSCLNAEEYQICQKNARHYPTTYRIILSNMYASRITSFYYYKFTEIIPTAKRTI